jgi:ElaB/YqjD/DUF883 family membrane-anchored ribosome-binding protein
MAYDESGEHEARQTVREGLRTAMDKASHTVHEASEAGERWAKNAEERALDMGRGLLGQGERAVDRVSRQVELNPLASLAVAFGVGFLCAALLRR